jgi:hypothetical protein
MSLRTVKRWVLCFREGDTSCEDKSKLGRPLPVLGDVLSKFFLKHPFASAKIIAKHFDIRGPAVKDPPIHTKMGFPFVIGNSETRTSNPITIIIGFIASTSRS